MKLKAGFHVSRRVKSRRIEFADAASHRITTDFGEVNGYDLQYRYVKGAVCLTEVASLV